MELLNSCNFEFTDIKEGKFKLPFKVSLQDSLLMLYKNNEILSQNEHFRLNYKEGALELLECKCNATDRFLFEIYDIEDRLDKLFKIPFENTELLKKFETQQLVLAFSRALIHQTTELDNTFPWKWWEEQKLDLNKSKTSVANMFITLISMCQVLKISSNEIFEIIKSGISERNKNKT